MLMMNDSFFLFSSNAILIFCIYFKLKSIENLLICLFQSLPFTLNSTPSSPYLSHLPPQSYLTTSTSLKIQLPLGSALCKSQSCIIHGWDRRCQRQKEVSAGRTGASVCSDCDPTTAPACVGPVERWEWDNPRTIEKRSHK